MQDIRKYPELFSVVTQAEAARLAHCHPSTIERAIHRGRVAAVRSGRVVLVSVRSLEQAYPHIQSRNSNSSNF